MHNFAAGSFEYLIRSLGLTATHQQQIERGSCRYTCALWSVSQAYIFRLERITQETRIHRTSTIPLGRVHRSARRELGPFGASPLRSPPA